MMPLIMAKRDEINVISAIRGKNETKRFLESMGFVVGSNITVVTEFNGNLIVNIKNTCRQYFYIIYINKGGNLYVKIISKNSRKICKIY